MPRLKPPPASLASLEDVEAQFYEALQTGDIEKLMAVWSDEDDVVCIHPNGPRVVGHTAIRTTFEAMFRNGVIPVRPDNLRRVTTADTAIHSVIERVDVQGTEGARTAWVVATNVYVNTPLGWRMVAHHASPGAKGKPSEVTDTVSSTLH